MASTAPRGRPPCPPFPGGRPPCLVRVVFQPPIHEGSCTEIHQMLLLLKLMGEATANDGNDGLSTEITADDVKEAVRSSVWHSLYCNYERRHMAVFSATTGLQIHANDNVPSDANEVIVIMADTLPRNLANDVTNVPNVVNDSNVVDQSIDSNESIYYGTNDVDRAATPTFDV